MVEGSNSTAVVEEVVQGEPSPGLDQLAAAIDTDADRCTNFYQYACGSWMNTTSLPDDQATFTKTFHSIGNRNFELLNATYSGSKNDYRSISSAQVNTVRDFYASCMDVVGRDARGIADPEFVSLMDEIEAINSMDALMKLHGERTLKGISSGDCHTACNRKSSIDNQYGHN